MVCGHCFLTFLPIHGANLAVFFKVLQSIDGPKAFRDGTSERHIVDDLVANFTVQIYEEKSAIGYEFTFDGNIPFFIDHFLACKDIVRFGYRFVDISNKWVGDSLNAPLTLGGVEPGPVGEFGIS